MSKHIDEILGPVDTSFPQEPYGLWKPPPRYAQIMFDLAKGEHIKVFPAHVTEQELMQIAVDAGLKKK
jgi:hypothetical protein